MRADDRRDDFDGESDEDDEFFITAAGPPKSTKDVLNELWYGYRGMARAIRDIRGQQRSSGERLSKVERFQWMLTGGLILLAAQAAVIVALIQTSE